MKLLNGGLRGCIPVTRLILCVILVLAANVGLVTPARAVGMVSHKNVVDTASSQDYSYRYPELAELLKDYPGAVASGSMFPDWGYSINVLDDNDQPWTGYSEVAHEHADCVGGTRQNHLSYRDAFANILQSRLSPPYTEDELKTIAFWFGLVSHVETDETFDRDFMPVAIDKDGGDHLGVDLVVDSEVKWHKGWAEPDWFFPLEVIAAAYQAVGCKEITVDTMRWAVHDEFIGKVNDIVWWEPLLSRGYKRDWMSRNYQSAPGGMNDLYEATATAWQNQWDTWKPVTTILLSPAAPDGDDGVYHHPVTIQFEATAFLEGQIETWYSLDGGAYQVYTSPLAICAEGIHAVSFYSINSMGGSEDPKTITLEIEPLRPGTSWVFGGPNLLVNGSFEQSDPASGVASSWTAFDNGEGAHYEYRDDSWNPVVSDGKHSQLIEINSIGLDVPAGTDHIAGIYQQVQLCSGCAYELSFDAMMRERDNHSMEDPYRTMVGWAYSGNGGTDLAAADHAEWLPLNTVYPMFEPGSMWSFRTTFVSPGDDVTVLIYAVKKWATEARMLNVNLDNAVLRECRPVRTGQE